MVEVTIKIPEHIRDVVSEAGEAIYVEALNEVARKRLSHTRKRFEELTKKIAGYESKYGRTYEHFSQSLPDTPEAHDDWTEWSYVNSVSGELLNKIEKLELITGR